MSRGSDSLYLPDLRAQPATLMTGFLAYLVATSLLHKNGCRCPVGNRGCHVKMERLSNERRVKVPQAYRPSDGTHKDSETHCNYSSLLLTPSLPLCLHIFSCISYIASLLHPTIAFPTLKVRLWEIEINADIVRALSSRNIFSTPTAKPHRIAPTLFPAKHL